MTMGTFTYGSSPARLEDSLSLEAKVALQINLSCKPFNEAIITAMQNVADRLFELEEALVLLQDKTDKILKKRSPSDIAIEPVPSVHLAALRLRLSTTR